jgi:gamma-glutamylcyclotransferase (GGCT)/AIG2-like uncharacterized protein YtfP
MNPIASESPLYLFVYGTLRSEFSVPAAVLLRSVSRFIGRGQTPGRLYRAGHLSTGEPFPGMLPAQSDGEFVIGEVYQLLRPDQILPDLDQYENEYLRREQAVNLEDGNVLSCQCYIYDRPVLESDRIQSGDFCADLPEINFPDIR